MTKDFQADWVVVFVVDRKMECFAVTQFLSTIVLYLFAALSLHPSILWFYQFCRNKMYNSSLCLVCFRSDMSRTPDRQLPFGGAKSGNNLGLLFEVEGDFHPEGRRQIMQGVTRRNKPPSSKLGVRHAAVPSRKRSRASASCCDPGTVEILLKEARELKELQHQDEEMTPRRKRTESASGSFVQQYLSVMDEHTELYCKLEGMSVSKHAFPFSDLPVDCKLKIFSFLTPTEKGQSSLVCREWSLLLRSPTLWRCVDFNALPLCSITSYKHVCGVACYTKYKDRMKKFLQYLQKIQPSLRRISFSFDIGDSEDKWLDGLEGVLRASRCIDLDYVYMNWAETAAKPFWRGGLTAPFSPNCNELVQLHRRRQRTFTRFFDAFTCNAPNITKMILPFDWSSRSLDSLGRLTKLHSLVLEKYFVFQPLSQCSVDQFFRRLPNLRWLSMEVWTPSGKGLILYSMKSPMLEFLDISQSRGFYVGEVVMPRLKVFKVIRHPWNGPLTCAYAIHVPCILELLRAGAPNLQQLNEHTLQPEWKTVGYPELDTVLDAICSCRIHKKSSGIL